MDYLSASHEMKQDPLADAPPWVIQNVREFRNGQCAVVGCHEQRSTDMACTRHEMMNGEPLELRMQALGVIANPKRRIRRYY